MANAPSLARDSERTHAPRQGRIDSKLHCSFGVRYNASALAFGNREFEGFRR